MDYITPAHCSLLQFRQMWAEFEWENKVPKLLSYLNFLCLALPLHSASCHLTLLRANLVRHNLVI